MRYILCARRWPTTLASSVTHVGSELQLPTSVPVSEPHAAEMAAAPLVIAGGPASMQVGSMAPKVVAVLSFAFWHFTEFLMMPLMIAVRFFAMPSRHLVLALSPSRSALPSANPEFPPTSWSTTGY